MFCWALVGMMAAAGVFADGAGTVPDVAGAESAIHYLVVADKTGPFQVVHEGQSHGGVISDVVDRLVEGSGITVHHHVFPVNRLVHEVARGRIKNWIAFDAPVWDSFRGKGRYLMEPLFLTRHVMLTCNPAIDSPIRSVRDLSGRSVVTLRNFRYPGLESAADEALRLVPADNFRTGLELVSLSRVDGFVEMASRLRYHLSHFDGQRDCMREVDISSVVPNYPVYLVVDQDMPEDLIALLDARLEALVASGEMQRIWRRYVPLTLPSDIQVKVHD